MTEETMSDGPDVIVIGGGPAGVSACWPMLAAGLRVLMIDGGAAATEPAPAPPAETLADLRDDQRSASHWLLNSNAYQTGIAATSPKLRAPRLQRWISDYAAAYGFQTDNFVLNGFLAPGGLSAAWGAGACCFTEPELKDFPFPRSELMASYQAVASRIGISGVADDDLGDWLGTDVSLQPPLPLNDGAQALHDRYHRNRAAMHRRGFRLGRIRQAVLSHDLDGRKACTLSNLCVWGCSRGAIYTAQQDIGVLLKHPRFTLWSGAFVSTVRRATDVSGFVLSVRDRTGGSHRQVSAPRVVLAAGTIGSTILGFGCLGIEKAETQVLSCPVIAFGLLQPSRLGTVTARHGFGMGQLMFALNIPRMPADEALFGAIYGSDGLLPSELIGRMPLSRPAAVAIGRWFWPAMLLGSCFFPGTFSNNRLTFNATGTGAPKVTVTGGFSPDFPAAVAQSRSRLARAALGMGAVLIPGSVSLAQPGTDMHYSGTMPMRRQPQPLETDLLGRPGGCPGLHVVDGSVLPHLPGKSHTLTIMANADRIGRTIGHVWQTGGAGS